MGWMERIALGMVAAGLITLVSLIVIALFVFVDLPLPGSGDDPLGQIAEDTCKALDGAGASQAGRIVTTGTGDAEAEGFTPGDLEEALRSDCPEVSGLVDLVRIAEDACNELEGAIVLQVGGIVTQAIGRAERVGRSGLELGEALRARCPDLMAALDEITEDQERRERLPSLMAINYRCDADGAVGTARNDSDVSVDVFIDVEFLDDSGVLVDSSIGTVSGLRPGETGTWEAAFLGRFSGRSYARCRAAVDSAFED